MGVFKIMKFLYVKLFGLISMVIVILLSLVILPGCYNNAEIENKPVKATSAISTEQPIQESVEISKEVNSEITGNENGMSNETESSEIFGDFANTTYKLLDGLHVTGKPIEIDIKNYRLKIKGLVKKELEQRPG